MSHSLHPTLLSVNSVPLILADIPVAPMNVEGLTAALDSANEGIMCLGRDWRITFLNRQAKTILAPSGEILGQVMWEAFPGILQDGTPFMHHYRRAMDESIPGEMEVFYPAPLNIWFVVTIRPTESGITIVFQDVTQRRKSDELLRRADERTRLALAAANGVGTWDWDVVNDLVYADEGFARTYGVDPAEAAAGLPISEYVKNVHPDDADRVADAIEYALTSGEDFRSDYRLIQKDGSICWISAIGRCQMDDKGNPIRFPGVTVDITEIRRADEALRMSEENHRIAAEVTSLGHCRLDTATRELLSCTSIFKANYGRRPDEEFTYEQLLASIHPDDIEMVQETVARAIRENQIYRAEYRVYWPDGSLHWISASGRLVFFEDGTPPQMAGVTLDSTQKHQAEAALMQAEKLAAVGRLASSIAHEINNPLESVTNLLYIAAATDDVQEIRRMLKTADEEVRRISIIANQTLGFHKQSAQPKDANSLELFAAVTAMYEGKLRNSHVTIEVRKRDTKAVQIYEGDIRQVLNNLIGNAIDAMAAGGRLFVRSRDSHDWKTGRQGLTFTIADTGTGMSPETQAKIFDAFFTTKGQAGTGLGLWVSAEIVRRHAGHMSIRSRQTPGFRGTVITLFLPVTGKP